MFHMSCSGTPSISFLFSIENFMISRNLSWFTVASVSSWLFILTLNGRNQNKPYLHEHLELVDPKYVRIHLGDVSELGKRFCVLKVLAFFSYFSGIKVQHIQICSIFM